MKCSLFQNSSNELLLDPGAVLVTALRLLWYNPLHMETPIHAASSSKTSPKDFFLWLGAVIALYGSVSAFIGLLFEYINYAFPDSLEVYVDPYNSGVRFAMAALLVLVPTLIVLFRLIRSSIETEAGKAFIWVRRWAIVLTLFIAAVTVLIDLITLINIFLGGEITTRFVLKVLVVLFVAVGVFLHFLADQKGYWLVNVKKANIVGIAVGVLTLLAIGSGFLIIGSPSQARDYRFDAQRVNDLQGIQSQVLNYYQQKRELPTALSVLNDDFSGYRVPNDPKTGTPYTYTVEGVDANTKTVGFTICAAFATTGGQQQTVAIGRGVSDNWTHTKGATCFDRHIDPTLYPVQPMPNVKGY